MGMTTATLPKAPAVPVALSNATMQVTVIIVNYNGGRQLEQCLRSLAAERDPAIEIILVDNASTDGSLNAAVRAFPDLRVIRSAANLGYGGGNNLGARHAIGRYLAFLNPDTVVETGWLSELLAALEAEPQVGLATSKILLLEDSSRINTCGNEVHCSGLTLCRGMGLHRDALAEPAEVTAVSGAAFLIRKDLFNALGGFDEAFFMYMEDTDLSWRARLMGYRCIYVPTSVVYHDYTLRFGPQKTYYQERNRYLLLLKALRWRTLLVLAPALIMAEIVTWGFILLTDRPHTTNKLLAYAWVIGHRREVASRRWQTQTLRRVQDRELIAGCTYRLMYEQTQDGVIPRLAHLLFDPLFFFCQRLAQALTRW